MNRLFDDATDTDVVLADIDQATANTSNATPSNSRWMGSGLGSDWDERVGAGAAAASIVSFLGYWVYVPEHLSKFFIGFHHRLVDLFSPPGK